MSYLPLFHNSQCFHALIIGGGRVALRRAKALIKAEVTCDLVAPKYSPELAELIQQSGGQIHRQTYTDEVIQTHYQLVLAVTNDKRINSLIAKQAKSLGLMVNVADDPTAGNVIFSATVDRAPLTIAINNGGASPVLSRLLRQQLEQFVPKHYGDLAALVGRYRNQVKQALPEESERISFWKGVLQGAVAEAVFSGQHDIAESLLKKSLQNADKYKSNGEVYLIGAGPGDPDLLTLRAFRLLQQADVVLYDALVSEEIMALVPDTAERIYVGKRRANHSVPQGGINQLLVDHALSGKRVVRLKGGDPFIFGRGGEEIEKLAAHQVPFQVVPGITAASGCSAYGGIPLTHRDYAQSVRFVTGQLKDGSIALEWPALAVENQTLVFYMGLKGLPIICEQLIAHGMDPNMPAALVEKGTTQDQRVITSDLINMPTTMAKETVMSPSLFIVGRVVNLHDKLAWFASEREA
jgi:uroporphyrin-III C-methyltransferase/precorrin-2 dehydrogenase/sirohydrochlorin ferrochelatase